MFLADRVNSVRAGYFGREILGVGSEVGAAARFWIGLQQTVEVKNCQDSGVVLLGFGRAPFPPPFSELVWMLDKNREIVIVCEAEHYLAGD